MKRDISLASQDVMQIADSKVAEGRLAFVAKNGLMKWLTRDAFFLSGTSMIRHWIVLSTWGERPTSHLDLTPWWDGLISVYKLPYGPWQINTRQFVCCFGGGFLNVGDENPPVTAGFLGICSPYLSPQAEPPHHLASRQNPLW
jgi:hypothetical protein